MLLLKNCDGREFQTFTNLLEKYFYSSDRMALPVILKPLCLATFLIDYYIVATVDVMKPRNIVTTSVRSPQHQRTVSSLELVPTT